MTPGTSFAASASGDDAAACQAPPATGPAGITLASPVEAITTPDTVRQGSDTPAADSSRRCAAAPPASDATSLATVTPSHPDGRSARCRDRARARGQAGESPGSGDGRSPAW
jgi:hypothetical protein